MKIIVSDSYNNSSEIVFFFNYENTNVEKKIKNEIKQDEYYINSEKDFSFKTNEVHVMIEKGNLYKNCYFVFSKKDNDNLNSSYKIGNPYIPIHKGLYISIKPDHFKEEDEKKLALAQLKNNKWSYIKSDWNDGRLRGFVKSFGNFTIIKDEKKPTIKAINLKEEMSAKKSIQFRVKDNFSGIAYYTATLNDEWILMEYDAKNNLLEHFFINEPTNQKNKLILTVKDGLGNETKKEYYFKR